MGKTRNSGKVKDKRLTIHKRGGKKKAKFTLVVEERRGQEAKKKISSTNQVKNGCSLNRVRNAGARR